MAAISEPVAPLATSEQAAKSVTSEDAASSGGDALFDKPLAGINTKSNGEQNGKGNSVATATSAALPAQSPAPPAAAPTTPAAEAAAAIRANAGSSPQQTPLVSQPTQVLDELSDSVSATPKDDRAPSVPDRETPTEMFIPKVHGELGSEEPSVNGSGNIPTMDLPTGQLDGARALSREDKTALLDLNALQRNPPNPAPSYATKTAPPPPPSQSGVGFPPSSSQPRPFSASSPSLPSFADPNNVSGSYSHPGTPGVRAGQSPSISAPSSQSPLVHKIDRALTKVGHAGNQLGLKVLVHFRSASQEQQILFVVVGTATVAVVAVMLFYLIFL